jgi:hypothetical protein
VTSLPESHRQLAAADRKVLINTLRSRRQAIGDRGAAEQLLHGEPHRGNVLSTKTGLLVIDLETCCRGPVEFDLAHVPEDVGERYADADEELLSECRVLVLAMVAAWRWDPGDQFPDGQRAARTPAQAAVTPSPPPGPLTAPKLSVPSPNLSRKPETTPVGLHRNRPRGRIAVAVGWRQEVHRFPHRIALSADTQSEALS